MFVRNSIANDLNGNIDYEKLDYMALQGQSQKLASENGQKAPRKQEYS